jgi:hypothetical protein
MLLLWETKMLQNAKQRNRKRRKSNNPILYPPRGD